MAAHRGEGDEYPDGAPRVPGGPGCVPRHKCGAPGRAGTSRRLEVPRTSGRRVVVCTRLLAAPPSPTACKRPAPKRCAHEEKQHECRASSWHAGHVACRTTVLFGGWGGEQCVMPVMLYSSRSVAHNIAGCAAQVGWGGCQPGWYRGHFGSSRFPLFRGEWPVVALGPGARVCVSCF